MEQLIPTGNVDEAKQFIAEMQCRIQDRTAELRETIQRIRDRAKHDERYEAERAYAEIEPLRRQMEAMILSVVDIASLEMPAPTIRIIDEHSR